MEWKKYGVVKFRRQACEDVKEIGTWGTLLMVFVQAAMKQGDVGFLQTCNSTREGLRAFIGMECVGNTKRRCLDNLLGARDEGGDVQVKVLGTREEMMKTESEDNVGANEAVVSKREKKTDEHVDEKKERKTPAYIVKRRAAAIARREEKGKEVVKGKRPDNSFTVNRPETSDQKEKHDGGEKMWKEKAKAKDHKIAIDTKRGKGKKFEQAGDSWKGKTMMPIDGQVREKKWKKPWYEHPPKILAFLS